MSDETKNIFDACTTIVTILTAIVAALWTLIEYHHNNDEARVQKTLSFYQYSIDNEYLIADAMQVVNTTLDQTRTAQNAAAAAAAKDPNIWTEYVIRFVNTHDAFRASTLTVIAFYESASSCVKGNSCDKDTAVHLFGQTARQYRNSLFPWIYCNRSIQRTPPKFAIGLDFFAVEAATMGKPFSDQQAIKANVESAKVDCPADWQTLGLDGK
jgi:hypothetical protein